MERSHRPWERRRCSSSGFFLESGAERVRNFVVDAAGSLATAVMMETKMARRAVVDVVVDAAAAAAAFVVG